MKVYITIYSKNREKKIEQLCYNCADILLNEQLGSDAILRH